VRFSPARVLKPIRRARFAYWFRAVDGSAPCGADMLKEALQNRRFRLHGPHVCPLSALER